MRSRPRMMSNPHSEISVSARSLSASVDLQQEVGNDFLSKFVERTVWSSLTSTVMRVTRDPQHPTLHGVTLAPPWQSVATPR
jgi:hypothetical protein